MRTSSPQPERANAEQPITVEQVDKRRLKVGFPADAEEVARHLSEADSAGFRLTGAALDEGVVVLVLTREGVA